MEATGGRIKGEGTRATQEDNIAGEMERTREKDEREKEQRWRGASRRERRGREGEKYRARENYPP